jgi:hypothetical protein
MMDMESSNRTARVCAGIGPVRDHERVTDDQGSAKLASRPDPTIRARQAALSRRPPRR